MTTELAITFEQMDVLAEDGFEIFVLNIEERDDLPPFYIDVAGRRFAYASTTFPVKGHGATLPPYVRAEEAAGHIVLLAVRGDRYMAYVYDPEAATDGDDETDKQ